MKKRLVAVLLSLTMCMAPVMEAGASAFEDAAVTAETVSAGLFTDSAEGVSEEATPAGEAEVPVVTEQETAAPEVQEEVTLTPEVQEEGTLAPEMQEEVTPTPGVQEEVTPTPEVQEEVTPAPENGDAAALEDLFVSEPVEEVQEEVVVEEETENQVLLAVNDFRVTQENWEQVDGKWKLRKNSSMVEETPAPTPEAAQNASADVLAAADGEVLASEETAAEEVPAVEADATVTPEPETTASAYFTAEDGIVEITTVYNSKSSVGLYYFDENGFMVVGRQAFKAGTPGFTYTSDQELYFLDKVNLERDYGIEEGVEPTPYNSELGKQQKGKWMWTGETFRYYSSNGRFMSMTELKTARIKAGTYNGYYDTNNNENLIQDYCLDDNGKPKTGIVKITEGRFPGEYYFIEAERSSNGIPGAMLRGGWAKVKDSKGVVQWRYYRTSGKFYDRGYAVTKLDATLDSSVGTDQYLLSPEGYILKSKMQKVNGYYYFSDSKGRIQKKGLVKYGKYRYYVDSKGRRVSWKNCWHRCPWEDNRYYYFGNSAGRVVEKYGWQNIKVNGKFKGWYYFNKSGNHYISRFTVSGYYFKSNGQLASGMTTVDGKKYYFEPSSATSRKGLPYKKKWITYKNKLYYASSKTYLCDDGWEKIKGKYYYFNSDGTVKTNTFMKRKGVNGYLDSTGKYTTGWIVVNNAKNQVRYVDPTGNDFVRNKSMEIDGLTYYFDKNGYRINDVSDKVKGPYYLEVDRINGVMTVFNKNRTIPVKSIRVSVGTAATPTPTGTFRTNRANRWQLLMGPSWGQYATHVTGSILIHSVACSTANSYALPAGEYNKLGYPASHGCIRCCVADALWVYNNCHHVKIKIYDGKYVSNDAMKGPLGKPALTPLYGSRTFDPTDPAV